MKNKHLVSHCFIIFCLVFLNSAVNAGDSTRTWAVVEKHFSKKELLFQGINPAIRERSIQNIEVIDVRSDTKRFGVYSSAYSKPQEIVLNTPYTIEQLLQHNLANHESSGQSIVLVVKDFWMSENFPHVLEIKDSQLRPEIRTSKMLLKIDVYIKDTSFFYPLVRIDTVLWDRKSMNSIAKNLLETGLNCIHNKIETAVLENRFKRRKGFEKAALYGNYKERFSFAAINDLSLNKGIYLSFADFKNNRPTGNEFILKSERNEPPGLFVKDVEGNEYRARNVWGVCNGSEAYIMQAGLLFKLYKSGNAFYWLGLKEVEHTPYGSPAMTGGKYRQEVTMLNVKTRLTPFLLNTETGEGY